MIYLYLSESEYKNYKDCHRVALELLETAYHEHYAGKMPEIIKDENGKPHFAGGGCCFSISHCDGLVVVALSENNVGVDAEQTSRDVSVKISERFLGGGGIEEWTHYEAFGKLTGEGIAVGREKLIGTEHSFTRVKYKSFTVCVCSYEKSKCIITAAEAFDAAKDA